MSGGLDITLIGTSGTRWPVWSSLSNTRHPAMTLSEGGVDGLIDAPLETQWIEDTEMGATFSGVRYLPRDVELGFYISDELAGSRIAGRLESDFRRDFDPRPDPYDPAYRPVRVEVRSELSAIRELTIQMREAPELKTKTDPFSKRLYDLTYVLRAGMPLWDSTAHDPDAVQVFESSAAAASGTITVANPTDIDMRYTVVLTPATWTLPDTQWAGAKGRRAPGGAQAGRTLPLPPILDTDGGVRLTRERRKLHAMTLTGSNFLGRMNGNWLRFDIPAYTPPTELPISYTGAPTGGARAEYRLPRLWSRPLGLEMDMSL